MPRTATKSKKVKPVAFESLEAADGMTDRPKTPSGPRTVYDVLAGGRRKENGQTVEDYTQYLESLSLAELQQHAYTNQLLPISNARILKERLLNEFHRERIEGSINRQPIEPFNTEKKKQQALDILKAGR
jgi:hypothetical protein